MPELQLHGATVVLDDQALARIAAQVAPLLEPSSEIEPWLGVDEAAVYMACPKSRIYDWVSQRRVRFKKDGRRTLFRREWLDAALEPGGGPG